MAYDVLCIGNAIVDLISRVPEDFISKHGFAKGGMTLVDADESGRRISLVPELSMTPGGSVANSAACLASLGSKVGFIGKVGNDPLGAFFREQMVAAGVDFLCEEDHEEVPSASCLAVVTPDGERTMSTFLGACTHLSANDIQADAIRGAKIVFIEGYLLDSPASRGAVEKVIEIASIVGTRIAITLSDARCVERHHQTFVRFLASPSCSLLIGNDREVSALKRTSSVEDAVLAAQAEALLSVITLGAHGAVAAGHDRLERVKAVGVDTIVDLVGAGDAFAAGFLHAYIRGEDDRDSLSVGAKCAAVVIQQQGARPNSRLEAAVYGYTDETKVFA
jgi:sugar/nucleoside kinase (ribokinase family)